MIIQKLQSAGLMPCPKWMPDNTAYLTIMGSAAYGCSTDDSDIDIYGFCVPPRHIIFPHEAGVIFGFGKQPEKFEQYQQHHIKDPSGAKEYDFSIFSIIKYFQLCMENNPNLIASLFTPNNCVIHSTKISSIVRENRKLFLHKGAWFKFKGYSFAQMSKIKGGQNKSNPKRAATIEEHGYDLKFAMHVVRLLAEVEQIMIEGDLDLQRNREQLKSIRRGEWSLERIQTYFDEKERSLEDVYTTSKLPHSPDEMVIRNILLNCLEEHYGDLSQVVKRDISVDALMREMRQVIERYGG
jgi:predicted nucleotidyltransferase